MKCIQRLIVCLSVSLVFMANAFAHTKVSKTSPADGEVLSQPPSAVVLYYNRPVKLISFKVLSAQGEAVKVSFDRKAALTEHAIPVADLKAGHYTVKWTNVGGDGHPIKGRFTFSISD